MKVRFLQTVNLTKTDNFGNLAKGKTNIKEVGEEIHELSDKWESRFLEFPEHVEIIVEEVEEETEELGV